MGSIPSLSSTIEIDHPLQPDWWLNTMRTMDGQHIDALAARFEESGENIDTLVENVELATFRNDSYRQTHERSNLVCLHLDEAEIVEYTALAGQPERLGEYVLWFGSAATAAMTHQESQYDFNKITLELGNKRQDGDWECTKVLDTMIRSLPDQLRAIDLEIPIDILQTGKTSEKNYLFMPMFKSDANGQYSFDYGILRRRRGVADIRAKDMRTVEVFKQSIALVVMSQLEDSTQDVIRDQFRVGDPLKEFKHNMPADNAAGQVFERAIREPAGTTRDIIPISALYMMCSRKSPKQAA